jgi:hypothetical protein
MGTNSITRRWAYPFTLRDPKARNDMHRHFMALSKMELGFFPIAASGFPNGSIHIGEQCDGFVTEDGFHCLADGEVVAYRLDGMDQVLRYEDESVLRYTVGFVLVRHRMALPPSGATGTPTPLANTPAPVEVDDDGIAIFSLYSYNRPFARYPTDRDRFLKVSLPFWQGSRKYRVGTRAKDTQVLPTVVIPTSVWSSFGSVIHAPEVEPEVAAGPLPTPATGLRVRSEGKANGRILGLLPRGCLLTVKGSATQSWAQIEAIERGTPLPYTVGEPVPEDIAQGWVFLGELDSTTLPAPFDDIVILDEPYPVKAGERIGFLGENPGKVSAQKDGGVQASDPRVAIEVFAGDDFPAYLAESRRRAALLPDDEKSILVIEQGARLCRFPRSPEHVAAPGHRIVPDPASPTSGAFVYGHLYRVEAQSPHIPLKPGQQYGDYVSATDGKPVTEAAYAKLSAAKRAKYTLREVLTRVDIGPCWGDRRPTRYIAAWTTPPLAAADADAVVGIQYAFSRADLDGLDATRRFIDHDGTRWWQVEVTGDDHKILHAWVADRSHPQTHWESPYAWPGFTIADGTMFEPMEALQRIVCLTGEVHPTHEESFTPIANALGMSEMVVALEKAIDHAGTLNGTVTAEDIAHARRTPSLSRGLSRVIARFQSQWSGDVTRWEKLAPFMDSDWPVEMQRQRRRAWWKNVAAKVDGFPNDPHVHHIHPFGWVDNFKEPQHGEFDIAVSVISEIIASAESGSYDSYNTGTHGVPGGRVGHSYRIEGPVKVTTQTINQILATENLSGTDERRMFATGKYQTIFETLREARDRMNLSGDELYDGPMQERVLKEHLIPTAGQGALHRFLTKRVGSVDDAQLAAAKQWASLGVPSGIRNKYGQMSNGTLSYYDKQGVNAANEVATERLREYLTGLGE